MLLTFLLKKYTDDVVVTFILSILICGTLEYFTSFVMEKFFHARWWDYSNRRFNINGRICLETLIPFGIMGCIIIYITNPILYNGISSLPEVLLYIFSSALTIGFMSDNVVSFKIVANLKEVSLNLKDNTEEISNRVKKIISQKSLLHRRVVNAFPLLQNKVNFKEWIIKGQEELEKIKVKQKEELKRIKEKQKENIEKIKNISKKN